MYQVVPLHSKLGARTQQTWPPTPLHRTAIVRRCACDSADRSKLVNQRVTCSTDRCHIERLLCGNDGSQLHNYRLVSALKDLNTATYPGDAHNSATSDNCVLLVNQLRTKLTMTMHTYTRCIRKKNPHYSRHNFSRFRQFRNFCQEPYQPSILYNVLNIRQFSPNIATSYVTWIIISIENAVFRQRHTFNSPN